MAGDGSFIWTVAVAAAEVVDDDEGERKRKRKKEQGIRDVYIVEFGRS